MTDFKLKPQTPSFGPQTLSFGPQTSAFGPTAASPSTADTDAALTETLPDELQSSEAQTASALSDLPLFEESLPEYYPDDLSQLKCQFPPLLPPCHAPATWPWPGDDMSAQQLRETYHRALSLGHGQMVLRCAQLEHQRHLLPDIKAGDMLYNAYRIGIGRVDPHLLLDVARYERSASLLKLKTSEILGDVQASAQKRKDGRAMYELACYENQARLMSAKAGDLMRQAYEIALSQRDRFTLYQIADYESENDVMDGLRGKDIRKTADELAW
ncbi:MAG: hypothetical protein ACAI44_01845 [Candidatus Sericytochromatia bacterium]